MADDRAGSDQRKRLYDSLTERMNELNDREWYIEVTATFKVTAEYPTDAMDYAKIGLETVFHDDPEFRDLKVKYVKASGSDPEGYTDDPR
jgi:hypothetical protein